MIRDVIDLKILEKIRYNPKIKEMKLQSIRSAISNIHKNNHGITMNVAAYEFARRKGFSIYRYLKPEDKQSLKYLKQTDIIKTSKTKISEKKYRILKKIEIDFENLFVFEAYTNAKAYQYIYILENSLRNVIFNEFGKCKEWWRDKKIVNKKIQDYAQRIEDAEKKYPWLKKRGDHPIYYVGLLELFKIIHRNGKRFEHMFKDLEQLRAWIKETVPIRNMIAHNIKIRDLEIKRIESNTDYICRLIKDSIPQT